MRRQRAKRSETQTLEATGFRFLSIERPHDTTDPEYRRQVRSHVTQVQHHRQRERVAKQQQPSSRGESRRTPASLPRIVELKPAVAPTARGSASPGSDAVEDSPQLVSCHARGENKGEHDEEERRDESTWCKAMEESNQALEVVNNTPAKMFSRGAMAFRTFALDDTKNTVGINLEALSLDLASLMSFYKFMVGAQSQTIRQSEQPDRITRYFTLVHSDPVLLTTAILIATRIQVDVRGAQLVSTRAQHVFKIHAFLIESINAALNDPRRALSDQLLMAVGLCASHEAKSGNLYEYHVHMRGLVQMIKLRGGFPLVGRDYLGIEDTLIWLDKNASNVAGCEPYFREMVDQPKLIQAKVDERLFRMSKM